jgi:hypothetical protein
MAFKDIWLKDLFIFWQRHGFKQNFFNAQTKDIDYKRSDGYFAFV